MVYIPLHEYSKPMDLGETPGVQTKPPDVGPERGEDSLSIILFISCSWKLPLCLEVSMASDRLWLQTCGRIFLSKTFGYRLMVPCLRTINAINHPPFPGELCRNGKTHISKQSPISCLDYRHWMIIPTLLHDPPAKMPSSHWDQDVLGSGFILRSPAQKGTTAQKETSSAGSHRMERFSIWVLSRAGGFLK